MGLASNLMTTFAVLNTISIFGLDEALIKFYSKSKHKAEITGMSLIISLSLAVISTIVFVFILSGSVPELKGLFADLKYVLLYIASGCTWVIFTFVESLYTAVRKSKLVLIKNSIFNTLKLFAPFLLVSLGFFGIFLSHSIPAFIALICMIIFNNITIKFTVDFNLLKRLVRFSFVNYISNILFWGKGFILPLFITMSYDPSFTAFFYIPYRILEIFYIVPKSIAKALFAEVSHDENGSADMFKKSFIISFLSGLFFVAMIFIAGKFFLSIFGSDYASNSYGILKIFAVAGIFISFNEIYLTIVKHRTQILDIFLVKGFSSLITIVAGYFLVVKGINSLAYAVLIGEALVSILMLIKNEKKHFI
jgi:O-antigen/teichoic acid export membrane protein